LIGYSPQEENLDRYFTVKMILEYQGGFFGLSRPERKRRTNELMERFGLTEKSGVEIWRLSGGMKKRLLIARALIPHPAILILDEPTAGVDVEQRHLLWTTLKGLSQDGTTIILTTHYIDEAEELCDRVGIIDHGQIIQIGVPSELIEEYGGPPRMVTQRGSLEEVFLKLTGTTIAEEERSD
jgi:ABC-2 type transport system ATP-binding protein